MEYLIKFGEKQVALSRTDVANLYPALEPVFLAIMQGLNETETLQFVKEYNMFRESLAENRKKEPLTQEAQEPIIEKTPATAGESSQTSAEIYDFNSRRKYHDSN